MKVTWHAEQVPAVDRFGRERGVPERYRLSLITTKALRSASAEDGRFLRGRTGVLVLHDSWLPCGAQAVSVVGCGDIVMLHFPKAALPLRPQERLLTRQLPADAGMGAVLARYLSSMASALANDEVGEREEEQLGRVALELAVMTLTPWVGAHDAVAPEARRRELLVRIELFIEQHLDRPDLTPTAIARHHHISLAHLHRLFQCRELTVAAWIRHRRLECCRADLADPGLRLRPVHAIGVRWGFRGPAEFSRAFRAAYGTTPGDYRRRALNQE